MVNNKNLLKMNVKIKIKDLIDIIKETLLEWTDDKALRMSAAISFYSIVSLSPFLMIITTIAGFVFGSDAASGEIMQRIDVYVGTDIANLINSLLKNSQVNNENMVVIIFTVGIFLWSSAAVFVEVRDSLNTIWGIEVKPGKSFKEFFKGRLFSLMIIALIGLLFILTLLASTFFNIADEFLTKYIGDILPTIYLVNSVVSFFLVMVLFAFMFKYLPSVKIEWKYIITGSLVTSVLFSIGNLVIGIYLSKSNYSTIYGAAGSLVLLLFWIYYSSFIFLFGAELTQVIHKNYSNKPLEIDASVVKIKKVTEQVSSHS